jgi:tetratricopeptide (TPR) repeat protein
MAKLGRNDPCHCGSGKKYKKCCQPKEAAAEYEEIVQEQLRREERAEERRIELRQAKEEFFARLVGEEEEDDELTKASNAAVDLVQAGKFQEAETAARDLIERYPEVHDGWDRLGMMYEAKGENKTAADCYRKALEIIRGRPEQYDPAFADVFVELIDKLDPPTAA